MESVLWFLVSEFSKMKRVLILSISEKPTTPKELISFIHGDFWLKSHLFSCELSFFPPSLSRDLCFFFCFMH